MQEPAADQIDGLEEHEFAFAVIGVAPPEADPSVHVVSGKPLLAEGALTDVGSELLIGFFERPIASPWVIPLCLHPRPTPGKSQSGFWWCFQNSPRRSTHRR